MKKRIASQSLCFNFYLKFCFLIACLLFQSSVYSSEMMNGMTMGHDHEKVMALVNPEYATHETVGNGKWNDESTWNNGVPGEGARVLIHENHNVKITNEIFEHIRTVRVDGRLIFKHKKNTKLLVDTIVVTNTGLLEIGTKDRPIIAGRTARIIFKDYDNEGFVTTGSKFGHVDYDPLKIGLGLICMGKVSMVGAKVTPYVGVAYNAGEGSGGVHSGVTEITLVSSPEGWKKGDEIIITGTKADGKGDEKRVIDTIDGATITFTEPLILDHLTPVHTLDSLKLEIYVANTSRNIILETDEGSRGRTSEEIIEYEYLVGDLQKSLTSEGPIFEARAHMMLMSTYPAYVENVLFNEMGRTSKEVQVEDLTSDGKPGRNPRARYPVHFHRAGVDSIQSTVKGCMVYGSPGWGYVNHGSNVDMVNNVSYNVTGSAYVAERGDELGSFINNLAIRSVNEGKIGADLGLREPLEDWGFRGNGFWFHSQAVKIEGNISAGASGAGFGFTTRVTDGLDRITQSRSLINSFVNNSAYGCQSGLSVYGGRAYELWRLNNNDQSIQNVITDFTAFACRYGVKVRYAHSLKLHSFKLIGTIGAEDLPVKVMNNNPYVSFENVYYENYIPQQDKGLFEVRTFDLREETWGGVNPYQK